MFVRFLSVLGMGDVSCYVQNNDTQSKTADLLARPKTEETA